MGISLTNSAAYHKINVATQKCVGKGCLYCLIEYVLTKKCGPNTHTHTHTHTYIYYKISLGQLKDKRKIQFN